MLFPNTFDIAINTHVKSVFQQYIKKYNTKYKNYYIFRPKSYYNLNDQEQELAWHPIDEIIKDIGEKSTIFYSINDLKNALEQDKAS